MSAEFESLRMKARKLAELAARGVGGEREVAKQKLAQFLAQHGLTAEVLNESERACRWILAADPGTLKSDKDLKALAVQCLAYVLQSSVKARACKGYQRMMPMPGRKRKITARPVWHVEAELTPGEHEDWQACFDHYLPAFLKTREHLQRVARKALSGFIHQHDLFAPPPPEKGRCKPLSEAELAALMGAIRGSHGDTWNRPAARLAQSHFLLTSSDNGREGHQA